MISRDELAGVVEVMGAATLDEMLSISMELSCMREEEETKEERFKELCQKAKDHHIIESVSADEVKNVISDDTEYFIVGPNAFPDYPYELSEIIDILELSERELDMDRVAKKFARRIKARLTFLRNRINELPDPAPIDRIKELEKKYSDLLNLYYDFDSWLPEVFSPVEKDIIGISKILDDITTTQTI
ncbi:MAG: hypothetical protein K8R64_02105 [Methanosarcinaceae archaeon]|nr:hypothetical protein [Methanosarcinaceae archaeon]